MKEIRFVLGAGNADGEITSKMLNVKWGNKLEDELLEFHHLNFKDMLADVLLKELKDSITLELVRELINDVTEWND